MNKDERGPPHPMDVALGARIRLVRKERGMTREVVAMELGVFPQSLQKYETGVNRVGFSRLTEIAKVLDISVVELIGPLEGAPGMVKKLIEYSHLLQQPGAMELLLAFSRLDARLRKLLIALAIALQGK